MLVSPDNSKSHSLNFFGPNLPKASLENPTTGEWELIGEDQLIIDPDDEASSTSSINTLTKDKLSYTEDFVDGQMNPYKVTTTWEKD